MNEAPHPRFADPLPAGRGEGGRRPGEGALVALLILVAGLALAQSWNRWLDPIIDTGRDLYISEQLFHGTELYRDYRYEYPPLGPYLLAAITSILGHSLSSFTTIGIGQSILIAALLWAAVRRAGGLIAALLFLSLSFTGASTWGANFIFPYSYAATFGMMFMLGALVTFVRGRDSLAIAALVLASWCKIEYAAGALLIVGVLLIARRLSARHAVIYVLAMVATIVVAAVYFRDSAWLSENIFAPTLTKGVIARRFFSSVSGFDQWPKNLGIAILAAAAIAVVAYAMRRSTPIAILASAAACLLVSDHAFFRGWGLLQLAALAAGFRNRTSPLIYFAVISIASTLRVPLNVTPDWYGCVLIVPMYALIAYVLFEELPRPAQWLPLIAIVCGVSLFEQRERFGVKQFPIVSNRGTLLDANGDRAHILNELIRGLQSGTLVVMPEGISLNYLTGARTPLTFHTFTPPETGDPAVEQQVIDEMRRHPPDRVAIVKRDVSEYGYTAFGIDYDVALGRYVLENYRVVDRSWFTPRFKATVLRVREAGVRGSG